MWTRTFFENGTTVSFLFENGVVWTGSKTSLHLCVNDCLKCIHTISVAQLINQCLFIEVTDGFDTYEHGSALVKLCW